jgi:hypothetical protein
MRQNKTNLVVRSIQYFEALFNLQHFLINTVAFSPVFKGLGVSRNRLNGFHFRAQPSDYRAEATMLMRCC